MTRIVAIETATDACSVALWQDGAVLEKFEPGARRQTERVLPMVEELLAEAEKLAKRIAERGAVALRMAKSAINEGLRMDLEAGIRYEHQCFSLLFATEDQKEGMRAFVEKRKPQFKGR